MRRVRAWIWWLAAVILWPWAGLPAVASPQRTGKVMFHIPAGEVTAALRSFSAQSGEQIVYPVRAVRGTRTRGIQDEYSPREALEWLVAGTGLRVVEDAETGALALAAIAPARPALPRPVLPRARVEPPKRVEDELVHLGPFEVRGDPANSYQAFDTNTLTSFRIARNKLPATTAVFTRTFMDDLAATSVQDVLAGYSGIVGADPNNRGAALAMPGDRDGGGGLGIRGLAAGTPKRDGFIGMNSVHRSATGYNDNFSVERIEVVEGPQSLLYGAVGGGGVINVVSKRAEFGASRASLQARFDQYGSRRVVADANAAGSRFALRVAVAAESRRNVRYNLGGEFYGLYLQSAVRLGPAATVRVFGERDSNWSNVAYTPSATDLAGFLPVNDPRRGQDVRYLALTGQLADLRDRLWAGPVDYEHISSFAGWWSSERIEAELAGLTFETSLGGGFSARAALIYSETADDRFTFPKNLVPAAGLPGAGANPFPGTAVRFNPGDNLQLDRTRGARLMLLHEATFRGATRVQTVVGVQASHQGPAFGSGGIYRNYYLTDDSGAVIVDPAVALDYGRVPLGQLYIPVQAGIPLRPVFRPGSRQVRVQGKTYVLEPRIRQDPAASTPQDPFGLVPNNPTPSNPNGFVGAWNRGGETHDRQYFVANFTEWGGGRVTTLAGVSIDRFETLNAAPGGAPTYLAPRNYPGFQLGASYGLDRVAGVRLYATMGTAGLAAGTTKDLYGENLRVPHTASTWPEFGVKYESGDGRWSAQLACGPMTKVVDETQRAGADFLNAINPRGINGRYNSGDQWINVDRKASSVELSVAATPAPGWRLRFNATRLDGEITSTVSYRQLYNDQFYAAGGVVTHRDGSPLQVDPRGAGGAATTPLTLGMINDPADPYYAAPDPDSGRITNNLLIAALTTADPVHGSAATGATGLPISAIQYAFSNPHRGEITLLSAGEKTTGINEYTLNVQSHYTFRRGWLRGVAVFADVRSYWRNRAYYTSYFPNGASGPAFNATRTLYRLPTAAIVGLGVSYRRRLPASLGGVTWTSQVNVENAFDHARVWVMPSPTNGANLNARLSAQPRTFVWSNTVAF